MRQARRVIVGVNQAKRRHRHPPFREQRAHDVLVARRQRGFGVVAGQAQAGVGISGDQGPAIIGRQHSVERGVLGKGGDIVSRLLRVAKIKRERHIPHLRQLGRQIHAIHQVNAEFARRGGKTLRAIRVWRHQKQNSGHDSSSVWWSSVCIVFDAPAGAKPAHRVGALSRSGALCYTPAAPIDGVFLCGTTEAKA